MWDQYFQAYWKTFYREKGWTEVAETAVETVGAAQAQAAEEATEAAAAFQQ